MTLRNPVELESWIHIRLHPIVASIPLGYGEDAMDRVTSRIKVLVEEILYMAVLEDQLPTACIRGRPVDWFRQAASFTQVSYMTTTEFNIRPDIRIDLRGLSTYVFEPVLNIQAQTQRVGTSEFLRSIRSQQEPEDPLLLDLEQRSILDSLQPGSRASEMSRRVQLEGRARMASQLQDSLKAMAAQKQQEAEQQKKAEERQEEIKKLGFGRILDLD